MKFVAGESFIVNSEKSNVKLSTAIYGNVLNSTGSIIPLIWDSINNGYSLELYNEKMTRFMIEINEAMDVVEKALNVNGYNVIPNLKSFMVKDLFEIYGDLFGLKYNVTEPRISEKIHEMMISKEEKNRTYFDSEKNTYFMHYKNQFNSNFDWDEFTSDYTICTKEELDKILKQHNYFKK
jgi:UDP-N-acetylglucosamine 4,6-dehydratase